MDVESRIRDYLIDDLQWKTSREELTSEFSLVESGLLDSLDIVRLVDMLETEYGIRFQDDDLVPENFDTIGGIVRLVEERRAA